MPEIGIMGGTFDPIHIGHLILGECAREQFHLDKILFMPSGNPPHKKNRPGRASDHERAEMVMRAVASNPYFEFSDMELHEEGYTYTFHTLETLRAEHPENQYAFILGADSLFDFDTWREPQRICDAASRIIVATRNHVPDDKLDAKIAALTKQFNCEFVRLDTENIDVSSSQLRTWIFSGHTIKYYTPDAVIDYIRARGLYRHLYE